MLAVRTGLAAYLLALLTLLVSLRLAAGLGVLGFGVGLACGAAGSVAVVRGLTRHGARALGPADHVTLARSALACAVAALVAESFVGRPATGLLVALAVTALLLDAVDGPVARRSGTASRFGARFDGEADAFLILVLSLHVARSAGGWVLLIGLARYLFGLAGWLLPWMRAPLPSRYWRKVVAAVQGVVLTLAAAGAASAALTDVALAAALVLLAESFGRDVWWLRRRAARPAWPRPADDLRVPAP